MKRWDEKKNQKLKAERGAGFDDLLEQGEVLDVLEHPTRQDQTVMAVRFDGYVWAVIFDIPNAQFKTAYRSRKLNRRYK